MATFYAFAAAVGLGWAVVSFVIGQLAGDAQGGDADAGGLEVSGAHADFHVDAADPGDGGVEAGESGGGHLEGDASAPDGSADHGLPLRSPTVIAGFAAGFGFGGLGLRALEAPLVVHLPGALAIGVGLAYLLALFLARAVRGMETTSAVSPAFFEGLEAKVIVPIRPGGLGEIAFEANGTRLSGAARGRGGSGHARGALVLITRVRADGVYEVDPLSLPAAGGTTLER